MGKFELGKPISQLFTALKSQFFVCVNLLQAGYSRQLNKLSL